tara:strand:- start:1750 stop:2139 length:390 start_codon:yes stop_codon:yes gene_type:complete
MALKIKKSKEIQRAEKLAKLAREYPAFKKEGPRPKAMKVFGSKERKKLAKFYKDAASKPAKALARKSAKKSIARKVVGKLGAPGKIAVGASILYHYSKKSGCKPGMSKVTKNGKSYCAPSRGSKKGRDY